jgi:hypothetical protein
MIQTDSRPPIAPDQAGRVAVTVTGADDAEVSNSYTITYYVFPLGFAERVFTYATLDVSEQTVLDSFRPDGFAVPANCVVFSYRKGTRRWVDTACDVLVDNVTVDVYVETEVRGSTEVGTTAAASIASAIALARLGVAHLQPIQQGARP